MTRHGTSTSCLVAVLLCGVAQQIWASTVYRCGTGDKLVYQDAPCILGTPHAEVLTPRNSKGAVSISLAEKVPTAPVPSRLSAPEFPSVPVVRVVDWAYNPTGQPDWLSTAEAVRYMEQAIQAWSECGIQSKFRGITQDFGTRKDGVTVVYWVTSTSRPGAVGVTRSQSIQGRMFYGADIELVSGKMRSAAHLQHVMTHEMGHVLGLQGHSPFSDSIMTPRPDRHLTVMRPSFLDIQDCRSIQ